MNHSTGLSSSRLDEQHQPNERRHRSQDTIILTTTSPARRGGSSSSDDDEMVQMMSTMTDLLIREAQAVSLWSCTSMLFRLCIDLSLTAATYQNEPSILHGFWIRIPPLSPFTGWVLTVSSIIISWIKEALPAKVLSGQAPGFIFANPL
jgi:hypothetical protein